MLLLLLLLVLVPARAGAGDKFYCNMKALDSKERARHQELSQALIAGVVEKTELPNGYGFRMAPKQLTTAAEWVGFEARCCPFFTFELQVSRDQGPVWLRITGSEGVKPFIRTEFGL
jgi:hypothetical protein